jgi:hypothetical protein
MDWRHQYADTIEEMWKDSHKGRAYAQVCCSICNYGTPNTCGCARTVFVDKLTKEEVELFNKEKDSWQEIYKDQIDALWNEHLETLRGWGVSNVPCSKCKSDNYMTCECFRQTWLQNMNRAKLRRMKQADRDKCFFM